MLEVPEDAQRRTLGRGAIGLGVLGAHVVFFVLLAFGTSVAVKVQEDSPLTVAVLSETSKPREPFKLPKLNPIQQVNIIVPPPDVDIPSAAISVPAAARVESPTGFPSPPTPPQISPTRDLPSMSTVAYLQAPEPVYPHQSRLAHEEGLVILRVLVNAAGHAQDIDVYRSSGHLRLDQEACSAVARAVFKPYMQGGIAHPAIALVPIEFSLHRIS